MRFTLVFNKESAGSIDTSFGGVVSFLPPVGVVILAQPAQKHINTNKNKREATAFISVKNK